MKRGILLIVIGAVLGGGLVWMRYRGAGAKPAAEAAAAESPVEPRVSHDTNGNVVVHMDDETQGDAGIQVTNPVAAQFSLELKGYGRVLDPAPLIALVTDLATARAADAASSNELARLKTLAAQGNASTRALQASEAAAERDRFAVESARDRLVLTWGKAVLEHEDLPGFVRSLANQNAALVRIDLAPDESLSSPPRGVRLTSLSGVSAEADFFAMAVGVDPQTQKRGFLFLVSANASKFAPGEAVTAHIKIAGEPVAGVIIPRDAVVRAEGAGWVYVLNSGGESFTRTKIPLDHAEAGGWFVAGSVAAGDYVVVSGAQTLLSEESKASIKAD